jgi:hypothetical protein
MHVKPTGQTTTASELSASILSGANPIVYVLTGTREIHETQLIIITICYHIVLLRQHVSTLSRGHHQAVDEVFIKS